MFRHQPPACFSGWEVDEGSAAISGLRRSHCLRDHATATSPCHQRPPTAVDFQKSIASTGMASPSCEHERGRETAMRVLYQSDSALRVRFNPFNTDERPPDRFRGISSDRRVHPGASRRESFALVRVPGVIRSLYSQHAVAAPATESLLRIFCLLGNRLRIAIAMLPLITNRRKERTIAPPYRAVRSSVSSAANHYSAVKVAIRKNATPFAVLWTAHRDGGLRRVHIAVRQGMVFYLRTSPRDHSATSLPAEAVHRAHDPDRR